MLSCQLKGEQLRDYCSLSEKPVIEAKLEDLSANWRSLQSACKAQHNQLEDTLLGLTKCQLKELLAWMGEEWEKLEAKVIPGVMVDKLECQFAELQVRCLLLEDLVIVM